MPKDTPFEHLFDRPRDAYLLSIIAVSLAADGRTVFSRLYVSGAGAAHGRGLGSRADRAAVWLFHLPQYGWAWGAALVIFLVGVVCGVVRAVTRSVGASFLVHVGYNGIQMLIAV